ncbi:MAG: glycine cleavage system protein R [Gammaproteobacteria bacterium]
MAQLIVLSVIGTDRTGIVQEITKVILDCGGNIEESRMAALGAEFAMLLLVSGNWHTLTKLESGLDKLTEDGSLTINLKKTGEPASRKECMPYGVDVVCLDHPGVVFGLADFFAARDIEIAELSTRQYAAAHTGAPMFSVQMNINIPGTMNLSQLRDEFMEFCDHENLDSILEPVKS